MPFSDWARLQRARGLSLFFRGRLPPLEWALPHALNSTCAAKVIWSACNDGPLDSLFSCSATSDEKDPGAHGEARLWAFRISAREVTWTRLTLSYSSNLLEPLRRSRYQGIIGQSAPFGAWQTARPNIIVL